MGVLRRPRCTSPPANTTPSDEDARKECEAGTALKARTKTRTEVGPLRRLSISVVPRVDVEASEGDESGEQRAKRHGISRDAHADTHRTPHNPSHANPRTIGELRDRNHFFPQTPPTFDQIYPPLKTYPSNIETKPSNTGTTMCATIRNSRPLP